MNDIVGIIDDKIEKHKNRIRDWLKYEKWTGTPCSYYIVEGLSKLMCWQEIKEILERE